MGRECVIIRPSAPRSLPVSSRPERGYFLGTGKKENPPTVKINRPKLRAPWQKPKGPPVAIAFIDGQNLFMSAKQVFGHKTPNYDVVELSRRVCEARGWDLKRVHFYTGVPPGNKSPKWHAFWQSKLRHMRRQGAQVFFRNLRYRAMEDGTEKAEEKGVDVRIAVDIIRAVLREECDVALVFSQDQDLSEVALEVREIAREQKRWVKIASAFPSGEGAENTRGVNNSDWARIDRETYDACLDSINHFPRAQDDHRR